MGKPTRLGILNAYRELAEETRTQIIRESMLECALAGMKGIGKNKGAEGDTVGTAGDRADNTSISDKARILHIIVEPRLADEVASSNNVSRLMELLKSNADDSNNGALVSVRISWRRQLLL
jgi:hypothetical protein